MLLLKYLHQKTFIGNFLLQYDFTYHRFTGEPDLSLSFDDMNSFLNVEETIDSLLSILYGITLPLMVSATIKLVPKDIMSQCRSEAELLWKDGKSKKWYYDYRL
jgi:hypothetical protein